MGKSYQVGIILLRKINEIMSPWHDFSVIKLKWNCTTSVQSQNNWNRTTSARFQLILFLSFFLYYKVCFNPYYIIVAKVLEKKLEINYNSFICDYCYKVDLTNIILYEQSNKTIKLLVTIFGYKSNLMVPLKMIKFYENFSIDDFTKQPLYDWEWKTILRRNNI